MTNKPWAAMNLVCLTAVQRSSMDLIEPTSAAVRRILKTLLRTDSDLEAFLMDYFREAYEHLSGRMDRVEKITLLLTLASEEEVLATLHQVYPSEVDWTWPPAPGEQALERALRLVCLHAQSDGTAYRKIDGDLFLLKRQGAVELWSPTHIQPGRSADEQASWAINRADLVVALLSGDFFASPDCVRLLERSLDRQRQRALLLIPLLVGPVVEAQLRAIRTLGIPVLPFSGRALSEAAQRYSDWEEALKWLRQVILLRSRPRADAATPGPLASAAPKPNLAAAAIRPQAGAPRPPVVPVSSGASAAKVVPAAAIPSGAPAASDAPTNRAASAADVQPPTVVSLPRDLVRAIRDGRLIPVAGIEISSAVQDATPDRETGARLFPTWRQLLEEAATRLDDNCAEADAMLVRSCLRQRPPNFLLAAETAQRALRGLWEQLLPQWVMPASTRAVPASLALARSVWALGSALVITTNYDRALRWACPNPGDLRLWEIDQVKIDELVAGITEPTLWHLHGSAENSNLMLALDGYRRPQPSPDKDVQRYYKACEVLRALLPSRTLLLVGLRFTDESSGDPTPWLNELLQGTRGPHYMLVRQSEAMLARERTKHLPLTLVEHSDQESALLGGLQQLARERQR